jgi:hypothetical protein
MTRFYLPQGCGESGQPASSLNRFQISRRWMRETTNTARITRATTMIPPRLRLNQPDPDQSPNLVII